MKIPFTKKDLLVHVPLSAPKVDGERVQNPTLKERFSDFGWLPLRVKPADRHNRRPAPQSLQALLSSTTQQDTASQATTPPPAQGKPLSKDEIAAIVNVARTTLNGWDNSASAQMAEGTRALADDHIRMAAVLDAIYKQHFGSKFDRNSVEALPDDRSLWRVFVETFRSNKGIDIGLKLGAAMRARETMRILYDGFDKLPHLRDIDPEQRWRLVADRLKIDMLAKHGIDTSNPLLCFMFDSDRGYAHSVARGYETMGRLRAEGRTFDAALIPELAAACGAGNTSAGSGMRYGAHHTLEGALALADWMKRIQSDYKVQGGAVFGDQVITFKRGRFFVGPDDPSAEIDLERAVTSASDGRLREIIESTFDKGVIRIVRGVADAKTLKKIDKNIVRHFQAQSKAASTTDEKILAAARVYYEGEHKHGQADGSYRLFGKMILNFVLLQQGELMTELYDPMRTDGQSPTELVNTIKEGQTWIASLAPVNSKTGVRA